MKTIGASCENCATDVTITGASNTGGMTGVSGDTTFENCTAKGRISGSWGLGGFVGYASSSTLDDKTTESTFTNCIADVAIEASNWNAGGFVGLAEFGTFKNSASFWSRDQHRHRMGVKSRRIHWMCRKHRNLCKLQRNLCQLPFRKPCYL